MLHLATDGSEHLDVGSYAVAVHPRGFTCATGNDDEDQSSFKQELLGFDCAARALSAAVRDTGWTGMANDLSGTHLDCARTVFDGSTTVLIVQPTVVSAAVEAVGVLNGGGHVKLRVCVGA